MYNINIISSLTLFVFKNLNEGGEGNSVCGVAGQLTLGGRLLLLSSGTTDDGSSLAAALVLKRVLLEKNEY